MSCNCFMCSCPLAVSRSSTAHQMRCTSKSSLSCRVRWMAAAATTAGDGPREESTRRCGHWDRRDIQFRVLPFSLRGSSDVQFCGVQERLQTRFQGYVGRGHLCHRRRFIGALSCPYSASFDMTYPQSVPDVVLLIVAAVTVSREPVLST